MLRRLPTATLHLLLFRQGPQDFPWDGRIHPGIVVAAGLAVALRYALTTPMVLSVVVAGATLVGIAAATRTILRIRNLENRFQQTYHALLAVTCVINLLMLWPTSELAPASHQVMAAMQAGSQVDPREVAVPMAPGMLLVVLTAWSLAVWGFVFRHAAGVGAGAGLLLAIMVNVAVWAFAQVIGGTFALVTGIGPATQ